MSLKEERPQILTNPTMDLLRSPQPPGQCGDQKDGGEGEVLQRQARERAAGERRLEQLGKGERQAHVVVLRGQLREKITKKLKSKEKEATITGGMIQ